jgi:alanine racemase
MRSRHVHVTVNLDLVRAAAEGIRQSTGVRLIAVIKADAYGLGAVPISEALAAAVDEFAYFTIHEAREVGRAGIVLGPPEGDPAEYRELNLRPTVANRSDAARFAGMPVAVKLDTGMQRFGCRAEDLDDLLGRCNAEDIFTHATCLPSVRLLHDVCRCKPQWLHAASTSLLDCAEAWLDGVRPGLALYRGATRVTSRLVVVRETKGGVGYTQFTCPHVGVILAGYCNNVQKAPVYINGRRQQLLEIGMNTSFVSVDPRDRIGDEVVLLGEELPEAELAAHFGCREHEILCRYTSMGPRSYVKSGAGAGRPILTRDALDTTRSSVPDPRRT